MPLWKQLLLQLYYHSTRPLRWWNRRRMVLAGKAPVAVLFYHRVADDGACEWTISNRMFARQIRWLSTHFELISLAEAQRRIRSGSNHRPAVAITFDDGYADNCAGAIPLLVREGIPCAYFVTLYNVLSGQPFAHDLLRGYKFAPNTIEQLRQMAAAGIEIGAHTFTHTDLGQIEDPHVLQSEVVLAGAELARRVGRPVRYFAFPFGQRANLNARVFELARRAGYAGVCSAYGGLNYPGDDAFHLQRIGAPTSMIGLVNRLTGDPRTLRVPRYVPALPSDLPRGAPAVDKPEAAATPQGPKGDPAAEALDEEALLGGHRSHQ